MKISINTKFISAAKPVFEKLKAIGYDGLDYSIGAENSVFEEPRKVWVKHFSQKKAAIDESGLKAFQTHATFPTNIDGEPIFTDKSLEQMKKEIEASALLGSLYIVIHPINFANGEFRRDEEIKANLDMFSRLEPVLREFDVKLGIENMWVYDMLRLRYAHTSCAVTEDMIYYIDTLNSDRFVACLDTGHIFMHAFSPANAARKLGKRLKIVHVQDNFGTHDSHKAPGQGEIDWKDYAQALKEIGYDGVFNMELNYANEFALSEEVGFAYLKYAYLAAKAIVEDL